MRSYQIVAIIGALFVVYDLIFAAHQLSLSVLAISAFAIISMFIFKNNTKSIGIGLIILSVVMLYSIGNFGLLRLRHPEIEIQSVLLVLGVVSITNSIMMNMKHCHYIRDNSGKL